MKPDIVMEAPKHSPVIIAIIVIISTLLTASCINSKSSIIYITGPQQVTSLAETLSDEYYILTEGRVQSIVKASNSDGAFEDLCSGKNHITIASRPISRTELIRCNDSSIKVVEFPIATSPIVVAVHPLNQQNFKCLSTEELSAFWNGHHDLELTLYKPSNNSDLFTHLDQILGAGESKPTSKSQSPNTMVTNLLNDINGIAYLDYATFFAGKDYLLPIGIQETPGTCYIPDHTNANSGSYTYLNQNLFFYFRHDLLKKDYLSEFATMILDESYINIITNLGYTTLDSTVYAENRILLAERTAGSRYTEKNQNIGGIK